MRWSVADKYCGLCAALGGCDAADGTAASPEASVPLVAAFVALLKDGAAEVRTAAAGRVCEMAKLQPAATVLGSFLPPIRDLAVDQSEHVRGALAQLPPRYDTTVRRALREALQVPPRIHVLYGFVEELRNRNNFERAS